MCYCDVTPAFCEVCVDLWLFLERREKFRAKRFENCFWFTVRPIFEKMCLEGMVTLVGYALLIFGILFYTVILSSCERASYILQ
jgi:hypothetical protein